MSFLGRDGPLVDGVSVAFAMTGYPEVTAGQKGFHRVAELGIMARFAFDVSVFCYAQKKQETT
jgi:hypothetical protein